ncbi:hypothetical protein FACS1894113_0140 [Alphaproteobacteria bacterium]|nr:hypothetical protein FACS1894113_0140 [Alphaproteobacteria bacterium]
MKIATKVPETIAAYIASREWLARIALSTNNIKFADNAVKTIGTDILKMLENELSMTLCAALLLNFIKLVYSNFV